MCLEVAFLSVWTAERFITAQVSLDRGSGMLEAEISRDGNSGVGVESREKWSHTAAKRLLDYTSRSREFSICAIEACGFLVQM
jgi:hypothetical protein